jgi:hypothetical protein
VQSPVRTAAAGLIGNVLEWFDYGVFGFFSAEIGHHFTPKTMDETEQRLVAFAIFLVIRGLNKLKRKQEAAPPPPPPGPTPEQKLLTEIRDLLKQGR